MLERVLKFHYEKNYLIDEHFNRLRNQNRNTQQQR
jgi:hypothetical protein